MSLWTLLIAGGIAGLDATSFPQSMVSRPMIAGALTGWVLGIPVEGAALGAALELFHLGILPIGAARYPEAGTAAVAMVWAYAASGAGPGGGFLMAVAFALLWERVAGASVDLLRRWNSLILMSGNPPATPAQVEVRHLGALAGDFVRGAVIAGAGGVAGAVLVALLHAHWPFRAESAAGILNVAALAAAAGALTVFGGWRERWRLVLAGMGAGVLLLVAL